MKSKKTIKTSATKIKKSDSAKDKITKNMAIGEVVMKYPAAIAVFMNHGLHCIGCGVAQFETIEQGASAHGIDVKKLMADLNKAASKKA